MKKLLIAFLIGVGLSAKVNGAPLYGYVQITTTTALTPTLQNGAIKISSGTVQTLRSSTATITTLTATTLTATSATTSGQQSVGTLKFPDATIQVTSPTAASLGAVTSVTAGYGLTGGGSAGALTLNLNGATSSYIQNTGSLQSNTTFYVSSGTATNLTVSTITFSDNSMQGVANRLLQISSFSSSTSSSTTVASYVPTNITASITAPIGTTKIKVTVSGDYQNTAPSTNGTFLTVMRGTGANVCSTANGCATIQGGSASNTVVPVGFTVIDTNVLIGGSTTYTVYMKSGGTATTAFPFSALATIILEAIR